MSRPAIEIAKGMLAKLPGFLDEHRPQIDEVLKHLVDFGYLDARYLEMVGTNVEISELIDDAVERLCAHAGIDAYGIDKLIQLYRFTRRNARCAVCEHLEEEPAAATARWTKKSLTYYIEKAPKSIGMAGFRPAVREYFKNWEAVCDLKFEERDQANTDIVISTGSGPGHQFDGSGGTLAWAYLPNGQDNQLLMRFDDAENFSLSKNGGIYLEAVSTHEFGHLIGLSHAPNATSLMSPYYNKDVAKPVEWDRMEAVKRYGPPKTPPAVPPVTPPVIPPVTPPAVPEGYVKASDIKIPGYRLSKVYNEPI